MTLGEAQDLVLPFLDNIGLSKLLEENKELGSILKKIRDKMKNIVYHPLGQQFTKLDDETEKLFLRYAEICEKNL